MTASMHKCTIVLSYNYIVHELFFITNRKHGENEDFHSSLVNGFLLTCALRIRSSILFLEKVLLGIEKVLIIFSIFDKFFLKTNLLMYILRVYINRTHSKFILLKVVVLRAFTLKLSKAKNVIF